MVWLADRIVLGMSRANARTVKTAIFGIFLNAQSTRRGNVPMVTIACSFTGRHRQPLRKWTSQKPKADLKVQHLKPKQERKLP